MENMHSKETYENAISRIVKRSTGAESVGTDFQYIFLDGAGASVSSNIPDTPTICRNIQEIYKIEETEISDFMKQESRTIYQATFRAAMEKSDNNFISRFVRD